MVTRTPCSCRNQAVASPTMPAPTTTTCSGARASVIGPLNHPYTAGMHRVFRMSVASVYPHYVAKVEKKGRSKAELDESIEWLTGFDEAALQRHLDDGTTFEEFFDQAQLNPNVSLITGTVCGVRVEEI